MRKRIYRVVETGTTRDKLCVFYNRAMIVVIFISLIPLFFKKNHPIFPVIDYSVAAVFILDYLMRWVTADFKLGKGKLSFLLYPLTFFAVIDLVSLLPMLLPDWMELQLFRMIRLVRSVPAALQNRMDPPQDPAE